MYLKQLRIVSQMAAELGIKTDAKKYGDLAEKVGNAFNSHFYDAVRWGIGREWELERAVLRELLDHQGRGQRRGESSTCHLAPLTGQEDLQRDWPFA